MPYYTKACCSMPYGFKNNRLYFRQVWVNRCGQKQVGKKRIFFYKQGVLTLRCHLHNVSISGVELGIRLRFRGCFRFRVSRKVSGDLRVNGGRFHLPPFSLYKIQNLFPPDARLTTIEWSSRITLNSILSSSASATGKSSSPQRSNIRIIVSACSTVSMS